VRAEQNSTKQPDGRAPWKWLFKNPKQTGYCDRHRYTLKIIEGKDGETRYVTTKR
jgi:hypothetical protein